MRGSLFALVGVAILLGAAVGPAVAATDGAGNAPLSVSVTQDDGVTVSVTANGSAVENASVAVDTADGNASYAGTGTYTTDANGTVSLPAPNETVSVGVSATAGDRSDWTSALLLAENASFGDQVSAMAEMLRATSQGGIGPDLAAWVVANNPGNAPDHAGPPAHAGPGNESGPSGQAGPPDHAGPNDDAANDTDANQTGGPPPHAGPGGDDGGGGPPAHAGPGGEDADDEEATESDG